MKGKTMSLQKSVELRNVSKFYGNDKIVFEKTSVVFPKGKIIGLVGENGCGKTTFIKMISGMTRHDEGEIYILGEKISDERSIVLLRERISILGDANRALYWNLSGKENIEYFWTLKTGEKSTNIPEHIIRYIQDFNMASFINDRVETYSKGMKQRLLLMISLLNDPEILFMDEPLNGLDYENAVILKQMINKYNHGRNGTVFITSHDQNFLNEVCDVQFGIDKKTIKERIPKDSIGKSVVYYIKTMTDESLQALVSRFSAEKTLMNEKVVKLSIDINDLCFYQELSKLLSGEEVLVLEANGA